MLPTPENLTHSETITVQAGAAQVYAVVSDVTRTGEWSPVCRGCEWAEGVDPQAVRVGDGFVGHNVTPTREWSTTSHVTAADGRRFAWSVGPGLVEWAFEVVDGAAPGTSELTETWQVTAAGVAFFDRHYGAEAATQLASRTNDALSGIPATLAAVAAIVEA